ncbi:PTS system fructose-specific EIIA component [Koleobacter methoxysyntrophicus]|jgi:PTS system mannose-specific IIA component|uniref:PTS system fructose-specific EIIA component n=1 Tax=Koleobacter methoxysyntrophicus TaxID=2751313 RepID=A0A8A0RKM4_9FIRM|nr:PTS sugar transporter subunit IIA [Koleobacter methoxysyntrophicus]QSQ08079.1 PTS system fructose-specific EIIA component [Koleobacter methoxysyntrophicus]
MIGILLVTHGKFGNELIKSAELIVGRQKNTLALGLEHGDDVEELRRKVKEAIKDLEQGHGVLVLTDLFGGSPSNVSTANMKEMKFQCLTGVNLPMLLEAFSSREYADLDTLADRCYHAGIEGIRNIKKILDLDVI